ncbi:hypothetical protein EJ04DRAFT_551190 [Polyplosphaeria fusca]|uniref:Uncharacterized protein n=1 Tax=Polyplosphaeria fusca TaxID=682080 RepID=A0A9P4V3G3_9PLEO|nr:hypothetical protein EJ04DRAFT_551190 [Polyplosphaeria fusca]
MSVPCYSIDGRKFLPDDDNGPLLPCNATAVENGQHSECCGESDSCMTNGLCQKSKDKKNGANMFLRRGCTDQTFQDPACANVCRDVPYPGPGGMMALTYYCFDATSWCCGYAGGLRSTWPTIAPINTTCCSIDNLRFELAAPTEFAIATFKVPSATSSLSSALSISSQSSDPVIISSSTMSFPTTTPTTGSQDAKSSDNRDTILGVSIGIPIAVVILAVAGVVWYLRRRVRTRSLQHDDRRPAEHYAHREFSSPPVEMESRRPIVELPSELEVARSLSK